MKECSFSVDFLQAPDELISRAETAINNAGGRFSGDITTGNFEISTAIGPVTGNYCVNGQTLEVTILQKPMFVGCGRIEKEITHYLGEDNAWKK